ncbi:GrpB family protein [Candidatus Bipolaricaulota bacterium]|nr:GrpB family protein [Candidatus Bipolaricaulota bacterium]
MANSSEKRRIVLASPNPDWKEHFEEEAEKLKEIFTNLVAIHHIGSTAIRGVKAKPVIDILLVVDDLSAVAGFVEELEKLGYTYKGENGLPGREYFEKGDPVHTHHLHVFEEGDREIDRHLLFRDYLNAHPKEAKAYSALKESLAVEYRTDPEGYTEAKSDFISEIDRKANNWERESV